MQYLYILFVHIVKPSPCFKSRLKYTIFNLQRKKIRNTNFILKSYIQQANLLFLPGVFRGPLVHFNQICQHRFKQRFTVIINLSLSANLLVFPSYSLFFQKLHCISFNQKVLFQKFKKLVK